jgi:hypothetical protein
MLDDSSDACIPSERLSREVCCLENEVVHMHKVEDYCGEYHGQYWLEMFRCALNENDQRVQTWLQQKFSVIILNWIHGHSKSGLVCHLRTEEYYLSETFRRFWHMLRKQQKFDLTSMAEVLSYLHVSMNGVLLDTLRKYSSPQDAPLISTSMAEEMKSNENDSIHELWKLIEGKLSNARERRMAYLLFQCALKPGEIVDHFPNEFSDVNEIARIRRNIMELLSRGDQIYFAMSKIS